MYRRALAEGKKSLLILEDDLTPLPELSQFELAVLEKLRTTDWGLVYLAYDGFAKDEQPAVMTAEQPLRRSDTLLRCTHFYAVHHTVLPSLIAFLEALLTRPPGDPAGGPMSVDAALTTYRRQHPELSVWLATRSLASQGSSRSDITPSFLDRVPGLRPVASLARSVRTFIRGQLGR